MSPFQALYGRPPPTAIASLPGSTTVPSLATILSDRAEVLAELKQNLRAAQQRMTSQANKHRIDKHFEPGDRVLLKLRPYRQSTVRRRGCPKLSRRYYGPFTVLRRIGQVAYELDLPTDAKLHRVFHISLLRPCLGPSTAVPSPLPAIDAAGRPILRPNGFLDQRLVQRSGHLVPQVLVQWENTPSEEASWEDLDTLPPAHTSHSPPSSELADKFPAIGEGIDTDAAALGVVDDESAEQGRRVAVLGVKQRKRRQPAWMSDFLLSLFT